MIALVVDDSLALRHIHRKALEQASWEVRTAGNGQEALEQLEGMTACDLVLTDWHMPVMDGIELVRRIRKHARYGGVPVLMITSEATIDAIDVAMSAGANDVLMKPYSPEALAERVDEVANE
ncbi:MAG: response regulator [Archangium sp.]|nr:response regulator [Archangium sp.]